MTCTISIPLQMGVDCVPVVVMASLGSSTYTQSVKSCSEKHKTTFGKSVFFCFFSLLKLMSRSTHTCHVLQCIVLSLFSAVLFGGVTCCSWALRVASFMCGMPRHSQNQREQKNTQVPQTNQRILIDFFYHPDPLHIGAVTCLAVSADTRTIVSGSEDKSIVIWTYH